MDPSPLWSPVRSPPGPLSICPSPLSFPISPSPLTSLCLTMLLLLFVLFKLAPSPLPLSLYLLMLYLLMVAYLETAPSPLPLNVTSVCAVTISVLHSGCSLPAELVAKHKQNYTDSSGSANAQNAQRSRAVAACAAIARATINFLFIGSTLRQKCGIVLCPREKFRWRIPLRWREQPAKCEQGMGSRENCTLHRVRVEANTQ